VLQSPIFYKLHEFDSFRNMLGISRDKDSGSHDLMIIMSALDWISYFFNKVYIVIDAVDECPERVMLLSLLCNNATRNQSILVTSRPEHDIAQALHDRQSIRIDQAAQNDIASLIEWELKYKPRLSRLETSLRSEIEGELLNRSKHGR
jgi:hypothetical protein